MLHEEVTGSTPAHLKDDDQIKVKHKILVCGVLAFTDGITEQCVVVGGKVIRAQNFISGRRMGELW
jgi:hypothetical protein